MKKYALVVPLLVVSLATPALSFAALGGLKNLLVTIRTLLNGVIPIVFGLALVYFFWGMAQFILHAGEPKTHEEGKSKMIWGIIALFVMVSIYGILNWISSTTGIGIQSSLNGSSSGGAASGCSGIECLQGQY
jgi:hypothetical protein